MNVVQNYNQKRVALVTGSTSGIGLAIAKQLANDGFTIAFHSKSSVDQGKVLAESYPDSSYTQADLSKPDRVHHLITDVLSHHDRLDVLVNNAGISKVIPHTALKEATPMSKDWTAARKLWQERSLWIYYQGDRLNDSEMAGINQRSQFPHSFRRTRNKTA